MKNRVTKPGLIAMNQKKSCKHCGKETTLGNIKKHEDACYLNPINLQECVICKSPIRNYKTSKGTCSKGCANKHFRSGENNGNFRGTRYSTICFHHHKKECIVCGENNIVTVHHYDHNHNNNEPENLIPLCPTHHQYVHSRFKEEVQPIIEEYITEWKTSV